MSCTAHVICSNGGRMPLATLPDTVRYTISQTSHGWLLRIENDHCSLSQLFASSRTAHDAVDRTVLALETLTSQHLQRQPPPRRHARC